MRFKKEETEMEYVTGIRETKEKELDELMSGALSGQEISVNPYGVLRYAEDRRIRCNFR